MSLPVQFLYTAYRLEVTFRSRSGEPHQKNGTGFFVGSPQGQLYLVTNRHVLDAQWDKPGETGNIKEFYGCSAQVVICQGRPNGDELHRFALLSPRPLFHPCYTHDVAVLPVAEVSGILTPPGATSRIQIQNFIKLDDLATHEEFKSDIDLGDQIGFPGYGEAYSPLDQRPIFRVGYVISDPTLPLNYDEVKGDAFLIEGFSTAGASGSPVFAFEKGFRLGGGIAATGKFHRRWSLLGVNAGHMRSHDFQHSQVSYVFKATIIRDIVAGTSNREIQIGL